MKRFNQKKVTCNLCRCEIVGNACTVAGKVYHSSCDVKQIKKAYPRVPEEVMDALIADDLQISLAHHPYCLVLRSLDAGFILGTQSRSSEEEIVECLKDILVNDPIWQFHSLYHHGKPLRCKISHVVNVEVRPRTDNRKEPSKRKRSKQKGG